MSDRCATRSDWLKIAPLRPRDPSECKTEWGPFSREFTERIGAPAPVRSVLIRPATPDVEHVVEQALGEEKNQVPSDVGRCPHSRACRSGSSSAHIVSCSGGVISFRATNAATAHAC